MDCILSVLQKTNAKLIVCGDFNINCAENSQSQLQLENYNLKDTVHFPTRTTATTSSTLDNIFIDKSSNFIIKSYINGLSDHDAQLITLIDEFLPKPISKTITTKSFNNTNIANFLKYLSYENCSDVFTENNTNSMFNNFLNIFLRGFNYSFPIYRKHTNSHTRERKKDY